MNQFQPIAQPKEPRFDATVVMTESERREAIDAWKKAKEELDRAKEIEMELRKRIIDSSGLFDADKEEGTQTVPLVGGWKIKAVKKKSYKVANKKGEAFAVVRGLSEMGEASARIAEKLFRFDANLSVSKYKELSPEEKAIVDEVITEKPAFPSLELVPPKA